ncbi:MAG: hydrogenase maturation nickel metallochaperone HypA [Gemmatimonadaceae bacterium]|jgi:hydrogenase nickel incorporation protein HypA/HybF|nr:hydrogenase maturation nickel metallochaperone HypA [Gemmatimonadaceae bacterium]
MHELSIAHGIVDTVSTALGDTPGVVRDVSIAVGALSGVVPDALHFCFEIATADTRLSGATLSIEQVPVAIWCPTCAAVVEPPPPLSFRCPVCNTVSGDVRRGRELDVLSYTFDDEPALEGA